MGLVKYPCLIAGGDLVFLRCVPAPSDSQRVRIYVGCNHLFPALLPFEGIFVASNC